MIKFREQIIRGRLTQYKILLIIIMLVFLVGVIKYLRLPAFSDSSRFCTRQDPLYQSIVENHKEWIDYYYDQFKTSRWLHDFITIHIPDDRNYVVSGQIWNDVSDPPEFFIVVESSFFERTYGSYGYMYSSDGPPSNSILRTRAIGNNIYCYWLDKNSS